MPAKKKAPNHPAERKVTVGDSARPPRTPRGDPLQRPEVRAALASAFPLASLYLYPNSPRPRDVAEELCDLLTTIVRQLHIHFVLDLPSPPHRNTPYVIERLHAVRDILFVGATLGAKVAQALHVVEMDLGERPETGITERLDVSTLRGWLSNTDYAFKNLALDIAEQIRANALHRGNVKAPSLLARYALRCGALGCEHIGHRQARPAEVDATAARFRRLRSEWSKMRAKTRT